MIFVLLFMVLLIFGPSLWVRYVIKKHHRHLPGMPGTGGELATHLLLEYDLERVRVETTGPGQDHYDPNDNVVRLSPDVINGKSVSAVAIAAHEVGHAIQFNRKEPVSFLRERYMGKAVWLRRIGMGILMLFPLIAGVFHSPHLVILNIALGVAVMMISVLMYVAILPEEWDASFNKALPIIEKGGYLPQAYMPAAKQVLKAAALTYVAAALANILQLWRWLRLIR